MAKAKASRPAEEQPPIDVPAEEREFTTREKGGHIVYLQRMEVEPNGNKGNRVTKRPITARLQFGVKFDPFVECGPNGKNSTFRALDPKAALETLAEKAKDPGSPIVYWDERPMTEEQSEHAKEMKTAKATIAEQANANAKLRALIEENGLKVPEDL